mgnify:CR=1 FL=1
MNEQELWKKFQEALEKDKDSRISRIVGDFYKVEQYVKGL